MKYCLVSVLALLACCVVATSPTAAGDKETTELLKLIRRAHLASRDSIRSCSCRVEFKLNVLGDEKRKPSEQSCTSRYWYTANAVRVMRSDHGVESDELLKDSVRKEVSRSDSGRLVTASLSHYHSQHQRRCDAWACGLLVLNKPGTQEYVPFELLLETARVDRVARVSFEGREQVKVDLTMSNPKEENRKTWTIEVFFDPTVNYLIRKVVYVKKGAGFSRGKEVTQFREVAPGLYFPERIDGWGNDNGRPYSTSTAQISEIQVNKPIPANVFNFQYPKGVLLTDLIKNTTYAVDVDGRPLSKETPLATAGGLPLRPSVRGGETESEPTSVSAWLLPVSVALIVLAAVVAFVRKWRSV